MKRILFITMWLLIGTLLTGCDSAEVEVSETQVSEMQGNDNIESFPKMQYTDEFFTWCDEEKQVYTSFQNVDKDIYPKENYTKHSFVILSLEHVNPDDIEIVLPIDSDYTVKVYEDTLFHTTTYLEYLKWNPENKPGSIAVTTSMSETYPYALYQCYQGIDWKKMLQLKVEAEDAEKQMMNLLLSGTALNDPKYMELEAIKKSYQTYQAQNQESYQALTKEQLPVLYCYRVSIYFGGWGDGSVEDAFITSESFETMDVKIGDKTYTQNIGQIRIHKELPKELDVISSESGVIGAYGEFDQNTSGFIVSSSNVEQNGGYPWGDGKMCIEGMQFQVRDDVTLTKCYVYSSTDGINLLGAKVHTTKEGGATMDYYWDLETPMGLEAGTNVKINFFLEDDRAKKLEYSTSFYLVLEYQYNNETYKKIQYCELNHSFGESGDSGVGVQKIENTSYDKEDDTFSYYFPSESGIGAIWFRYAVVFDELDLESYIEEYYRVINETWREELSW